MSDDIRDLLNGAFADEPPLRFSRAQVIQRGRRVQRNRRLFAAGSAVVSVAVLTAGILFVAGLQGASGQPVDPARSPACPPTIATDGSFAYSPNGVDWQVCSTESVEIPSSFDPPPGSGLSGSDDPPPSS
jgi:hypothetical protein